MSNPRKTARDRAAYIARHRVNENHNDPLKVAAVGREQEPGPQHGGVQAALPVAVSPRPEPREKPLVAAGNTHLLPFLISSQERSRW